MDWQTFYHLLNKKSMRLKYLDPDSQLVDKRIQKNFWPGFRAGMHILPAEKHYLRLGSLVLGSWMASSPVWK